MEQQQSSLQQQFPLSPRKFWKKILGQIIPVFFFSLFVGIILALVSMTVSSSTLLNIIVFIFVFLFIFCVTTFLYSWYIKTYIKRYYYDGGDSFITIKKRVFSPAEIHVQWQKIQDVYVDQDIMDRIMGLYDVHIASATATSGMEAHIDGLDQEAADGLKKFLLDKVSNGSKNNQNVSPTPIVGNSMPIKPQSSDINITEEISNNKYPLSSKWVAMKLISRIISPFIYWAFVIFFFFIRGLNQDVFHLDYSTIILLYIIIAVLSAITHCVTFFIWKKNYTFNFTKDNIYYRQGVISISEKHMPYSSIQDVTVRQGVLERILGLGSVSIENAAQQAMVIGRRGQPMGNFSGINLQGLSIEDANKITDILKTTVLGKNNSQYGL